MEDEKDLINFKFGNRQTLNSKEISLTILRKKKIREGQLRVPELF